MGFFVIDISHNHRLSNFYMHHACASHNTDVFSISRARASKEIARRRQQAASTARPSSFHRRCNQRNYRRCCFGSGLSLSLLLQITSSRFSPDRNYAPQPMATSSEQRGYARAVGYITSRFSLSSSIWAAFDRPSTFQPS